MLLLPFAFADEPTVKPGGMIFAHYGYDLESDANEFAVDRVYLRLDAQMTKQLGARITLDADRLKDSTIDTKYRVFVKHAYLEVKDLAPGIKVRAGMIDTPYTPFYDAFWGNRYITESFAKSRKVLETADLGIGAWGEHAGGTVNWNLSLLNGEGYGKLEVDASKTVQARLTVDPLVKGGKFSLPLTGFVSGDTEAQLIWAGAAGFKAPFLVAWAEVLGHDDKLGFSGTLNPKVPDVVGVVGRVDQFDEKTTIIAGVTRDWADKVSTAITYERASETEHGIFVRMQAGF